MVRRLRKAKGAEPAQYVRVGVQMARLPFENMTLPEVMAQVLGDKAMSQTELAVAMLDAGYDTTMTPRRWGCRWGRVAERAAVWQPGREVGVEPALGLR